MGTERPMTRSRFWMLLAAILILAAALRAIYPTADPPWRSTVGVVWHDEGAWTHNARNKVLFGAWRQDEWNPVYIAPVFTALEYGSFTAFGVGLRQARLVSEAAGVLSVLLLALGLRRIASDRAALIGGALLATNYVYVMYDRAAIMEGLMAAFIVASWYCSARAEREPGWGAAAGLMAALAFFTKAAAAFYVGSLALVALLRFLPAGGGSDRSSCSKRAAMWTLAGLAASFGLIAALFVLPHWADYRFYNWQMSVTRKPSYDLVSIAQRITWFPVLHDTFSRSWPELLLTVLGAWQIATRWRQSSDAERLLLLWVAVGSLELLLHDVGNERRFVFLIPAMAAFSGIALDFRKFEFSSGRKALRWLAAPAVFYSAYVLVAPLARLFFLADVHNHVLHSTVRLSAVAAFIGGSLTLFAFRRTEGVSIYLRPSGAIVGLLLMLAWDGFQFVDWARGRTYKNYQAMIALDRALPPDTMIQGKLANGLDLENRIRPIFIGHDFGNYADRKRRDDVRYILTYTAPKLGYEGDQIIDVLEAYPGWRVIMTFDVAESSGGHDTAALIDKRARH
jgi:4-amino-4-deoxy-L-arabinose transferase-like glycosyltransferase